MHIKSLVKCFYKDSLQDFGDYTRKPTGIVILLDFIYPVSALFIATMFRKLVTLPSSCRRTKLLCAWGPLFELVWSLSFFPFLSFQTDAFTLSLQS